MVLGGNNTITLSGTAQGPKDARDVFGMRMAGVYARSVSFTLDVDKAPTTEFGRTTYKYKNRRIFQVTTQKGWGAAEVAERLADKVNALPDFRAAVAHHKDGSSSLTFEKR